MPVWLESKTEEGLISLRVCCDALPGSEAPIAEDAFAATTDEIDPSLEQGSAIWNTGIQDPGFSKQIQILDPKLSKLIPNPNARF